MSKAKIIMLSSDPESCPACPVVKVIVKRMLRKELKDLGLGFEERDVDEDEWIRKIGIEKGVWYFNLNDASDPLIIRPQLFLQIDGEIYFLYGKPVTVKDEIKQLVPKRIRELVGNRGDAESISRRYLKEDMCDPETETVLADRFVPLALLRPDVCYEECKKTKFQEIADEILKLMRKAGYVSAS